MFVSIVRHRFSRSLVLQYFEINTCIQEDGEARWFAAQLEETGSASNLIGQEDAVRWAQLLQKCRTFDDFMQVRYASVKRYGAEVCGEGQEGRKEGTKCVVVMLTVSDSIRSCLLTHVLLRLCLLLDAWCRLLHCAHREWSRWCH